MIDIVGCYFRMAIEAKRDRILKIIRSSIFMRYYMMHRTEFQKMLAFPAPTGYSGLKK